MRKILAIITSIILIFSLCACARNDSVDGNLVKVGLICLHDQNSSYDKNFIDAFEAACKATGVDCMIKTNIPESAEAYDTAAELADSGCQLVFADSFGHEDYMIQAAQEFSDVQFCHATGTKAHTEGLSNYHNAFAAIYEGRYLDGIALGLKLNEMIESGAVAPEDAYVGYVGAYQYAEVISGYTSFFLGVRSVCPDAKMKVTFTGTWYDEALEKEAANILINNGCVVISSHADSMGVPTACEAEGVPFVFYNDSVIESCPNTFIIATRINWQPYFEYIIKCMKSGETIDTDWIGTIATNSVQMTEINSRVAAAGTKEALDEAIALFKENKIYVFDCESFTVNGKIINSYLADVDTDPTYTPDTEVINDGYFHESEFRSAPYFDIAIDGIEILGQ